MAASEFTGFRGIAARANYLAADRIDLQYSAKEVCRFMSSPMETSVAAMKTGQVPPGPQASRLDIPVAEG